MMNSDTNRIKAACIGECMVELSPTGNESYRKGFAGDSLNTAVYLQRVLANQAASVSYVTALGNDALSQQMRSFFASENLDCSLIGTIEGKQPGLYSIELDDQGERSFQYWRNDSAARRLLDGGLTAEQEQQLTSEFDLIYVSGISLAILNEDSRTRLFNLLREARKKGVKIAFDSNYRPCLWESPETARAAMEQCLSLVDFALMTFDDEQMLHGDSSTQETMTRLQQLNIPEIIVKDGANGCRVYSNGDSRLVPAVLCKQVIDTTSAGDSFNAGYLAARMTGRQPEHAAEIAHSLASLVIQHKGAILPKEQCPTI